MSRVQILAKVKDWLFKLSLVKKIILIVIVFGFSWFLSLIVIGSKKEQQQYQTATVERGTIVSSVSASGTVLTS
ncbi:hypothetical protein HY612_00765, partial [Candidatus Roizmanbacteria bacterium]|nr:hypothetical protein [Candidatus Roizmanbacteria bacterium]